MSLPPPFFLFLLFPYFLFPLIFIPPSAPPFRSSSTFYLFGEIYQQFSLFTTNSLVLSRAGIPGHDQEWVLQLIRGRLFIYSRLEERFLPPSKDSPTFQPSCNFDASQKKKKGRKTPFPPPQVYVLLKDARLFIGEQRLPPSHLFSPSLYFPFLPSPRYDRVEYLAKFFSFTYVFARKRIKGIFISNIAHYV